MKNNQAMVSSAIIFNKKRGKFLWLLVKQSEDASWELPKTNARGGESSVRASIRMMGEQGGAKVIILEEAGRASGVATFNKEVQSVKYLYYLGVKGAATEEAVGFYEEIWLEYSKAMRRLTTKRDQNMLRSANKILTSLKKEDNFKERIGE